MHSLLAVGVGQTPRNMSDGQAPHLTHRVVLRAVADFLTLGDMSRVSRVSKSATRSLTFAKFVSPRAMSVFYDCCGGDRALAAHLAKRFSFETLCALGNASNNLLANPDATFGFAHWQFRSGNAWIIAPWDLQDDRIRAFHTSFYAEPMSQEVSVDLPERGGVKWFILSGAVYRFRAVALGTVTFTTSVYQDGAWKVLSSDNSPHKIDLTKELGDPKLVYCFEQISEKVTRVKVAISGKDRVMWSGHYGPRFGFVYLRLVPLSTIRDLVQ